MRLARPAILLVASLLVAGCTWPGGGESAEGPDLTGYTGDGPGFALAVTNNGTDPMTVTVRVIGAGNADLGNFTERVEPGQTAEKWFSLSQRQRLSARMNYLWGAQGSASQGLDEQVFDANDCPKVSRLAWELRQQDGAVGHVFAGKTCVGQAAA